MKKTSLLLSILLLAGAFLIPSANAQDIRTRMKQRIPQIAQLKKSGIIGEDAKGYLAVIPGAKANADAEKLIKAENADRKTVYTYIAKKEKVELNIVETQRAAKLAQIAKPGEYIQQKDKWIKK